MKKLVLVLLFIWVFMVFIQAQQTKYISLETLLQKIETSYPSILQYQQNIKSWQAKADGSTAWMPPTFGTGIMRFPYKLSMLNEKNDPMNQAGISLSIEQMIPNPAKLNAKKEYLNSLTSIEISKAEWTKNELRREAKIIYYSRFVNEQKKKIISQSEELLNLLISTSEAKFSNNQSQLQTIYKAKARLSELKNMQYMLSSMIAESNISLNSLMVRDVNSTIEIDTLIEPRKYSIAITDSISILNRSDISSMTSLIQSMQLEQQVMKTGNKPDFGVRAEHMYMFGMHNQWSVMGMMTIPIVPWSSKMYSSETKSIDFQIKAMEFERQKMELMAKKMVAEKLSLLNYESIQYENYKTEIIPAFENNLQANLLAYRQNTGDFFVLLDAWEMLLMKKLELYDKLFNVLKLEAEYEYEKEIR